MVGCWADVDVATGTAVRAVCTAAVVRTGTGVVVLKAIGVVVLSLISVVVAGATVLLTGGRVDTWKPAAATAAQQKKRMRTGMKTVFSIVLFRLSGGTTGCGGIREAPDDKQLAGNIIILSAYLGNIRQSDTDWVPSDNEKKWSG